MWLPLTVITHSNQGRKLLQIFLNDRHDLSSTTAMRCSQKLVTHICCCGVSCKPFLQCAFTSWSRGDSNLVNVRVCMGGGTIFGPNLMLASNQFCDVFAVCAVQTDPEASSRSLMLRRQASWLRLDDCSLILCGNQRHHSQTLRPDHSVCWKTE